jgi:flagellar hook-associated protein 3 FlgL
MLSGIDPAAERFLYDINRIKARGDRAQRQISSGYRVTQPSDDPGAVPEIIHGQTGLDRVRQVQRNLGQLKAETDAAERALQAAVALLDRVSVLASQGASSTVTADTRAVLAGEVGAVLERLVEAANTSVNNRFVFAGDLDQTLPYSLDPTLTDGVSIYAGGPATREAEGVNGGRFAVSRNAETIFQNGSEANVFGTVNELRSALEANDEPAIWNALAKLAPARQHLNRQLAFYGTVQNRVDGELASASAAVLDFQQTIARLRETDLVEASLELVQSRTGLEAALSARARLPRASLFDYLG